MERPPGQPHPIRRIAGALGRWIVDGFVTVGGYHYLAPSAADYASDQIADTQPAVQTSYSPAQIDAQVALFRRQLDQM